MRREKVHRVEGHKCTLPTEEDLITLFVHEGVFVNLRRQLRIFLMINSSYPECRSVFKSTARIRWEEYKHLRRYFYMIHPFSEGRVTWEIIMIVIYTSIYIIMPFDIIYLNTPWLLMYVMVFLCTFCLIDVILTFFTGYYDIRGHKIVFETSKVCKHYVLGMFIVDVISSIPYTLIIYFMQQYELFHIKYLYFLKLFRLRTLLTYIKNYCIRLDIWDCQMSAFGVIVYFLIVVWWGTAFVYVRLISLNSDDAVAEMARVENEDQFTPLIQNCLQVVMTILLVRISPISDESTLIQVFYISLIFAGVILNLIMFTQVMRLFRRSQSSKNKYLSCIQEIGEYMRYKELPEWLQEKVFRYMKFKYQNNIFREGDISQTLSKSLGEEVLFNTCRRLIEQVDIFKEVPSRLLGEIVKRLRSDIYLPSDLIVQSGSVGHYMYFIYIGTVAVYSATNVELSHLKDGNSFGEIALLSNQPRVVTVVAVTDCEIFRLHRKDFLEVLGPYPQLVNKIRGLIVARLWVAKKTQARKDSITSSLLQNVN